MTLPVESLKLRQVLIIVDGTKSGQYTFNFSSPEMAEKKATLWRRQIHNNGMQWDINVSKHASCVTVRRWRAK